MARLHEYQSKHILAKHGIEIPRGEIAVTPAEARAIAEKFACPTVIKAQVHETSRAAGGAILFASDANETFSAAREIFAKTRTESVLVDEKLTIEQEFYLGFIIDDRLKRPVLLFSGAGGSGIEERAATLAKMVCSIQYEPTVEELADFLAQSGAPENLREKLAEILQKLYRAASYCEARIAEINPLALTENGKLIALDARISVDDYAVFRHEDLGIEMARELGHTPTRLEKIAWEIERDDFRGTFYFVEILPEVQSPKSKVQSSKSKVQSSPEAIRIGFHGAGGGGSMASLDAAQRNGLQPACYVDTSGNPPASKVYRAARIILSIPNIEGYFLSGSGVASQEQFQLARAVIKAFREVRPEIPAVLRLGGNGEEYAKELVEKFTADLPAPVEAYQKTHSADFCAARLRDLIVQSSKFKVQSQPPAKFERQTNETKTVRQKPHIENGNFYSFKTRTGKVFYDHAVLENYDTTPMIESCPTKILSKNEKGLPVLNISEAEAERGKCVECLACEFAAWEIAGIGKGAFIEFPIDGLE